MTLKVEDTHDSARSGVYRTIFGWMAAAVESADVPNHLVDRESRVL